MRISRWYPLGFGVFYLIADTVIRISTGQHDYTLWIVGMILTVLGLSIEDKKDGN